MHYFPKPHFLFFSLKREVPRKINKKENKIKYLNLHQTIKNKKLLKSKENIKGKEKEKINKILLNF